MAFTQEQLDAMDTAIATMTVSGGPQRIRHGEKEITFYSLADMIAARSAMASALSVASSRRAPRFQLADFSCGAEPSSWERNT